MPEGIKTKGIPHKALRSKIEKVRKTLKKDPTIIEMFKEYNIPIDEIDLVPMCFADIEVSARTDHGMIYFNINLADDFDEAAHYMAHELTHSCQQTTGDKPTQGADDGEYLDNKDEIEGFQNQTKFISETEGEDQAEDYIEQVLDHHDLTGKKRDNKKEELLIDARIREFKKMAI